MVASNPVSDPLYAADDDSSNDPDSGKPINELEDSLLTGTGPWPERLLTNWSFGAGESLTYSIGWEKVTAGCRHHDCGDAG
jgi:hypothetical protein